MAEKNINGNIAPATNGFCIPTIHLVLQGKGGVGKTVVAGWLSEFLISRGQPVQCIDGDPVNRSLAQYKSLPVEKLDLVNQDGIVVRSRYDGLIDRFLNEEAVFVVDRSATAFLPFWTYIVESDIVAVLRDAGRRVYLHIPISGGEMLNDTLLGFKTLAETAAEKSLVVWINEYFGPIARDGKNFDQMQVYMDLDEAGGQAHLESAVRSASNRSRSLGSTDTVIPDALPIFGGYHDGNLRNQRDNWANSQVFSQTACDDGRTPLVVMIPEDYERLPEAQRSRIIPICIAAFDQYGQRIAKRWFTDGVAPVRDQLVKLAQTLLGDAWCVSELAEAAVHRLWARYGSDVGRFPARRVLKKALCLAEEWKAGDWRKRRYPKLYLAFDSLDEKVRDQMLADPNEYEELFELVGTLTEASLLSGTARIERVSDASGGLLCEVGSFGIALMKDFTSVLGMNRNARSAVLAALRAIYDGHWTRRLGTDGGISLSWKGKLGIIGGVTSAIDAHHAVTSAMGERFLLYRLPELDRMQSHEMASRATSNQRHPANRREELASSVQQFFAQDKTTGQALPPNDQDNDWVAALATFVSRARSAVDRDGYRRDIELVHSPEAPGRLGTQLGQLYSGIRSIGIPDPRARTLVRKVGLDSLPVIRGRAISFLLAGAPRQDLRDIAISCRQSESATRRALEDLECHRVVQRESNAWSIRSEWMELCDDLATSDL